MDVGTWTTIITTIKIYITSIGGSFGIKQTFDALVQAVWISKKLNKHWDTRKHVHNAFVCFTNASPVLDFLIYATERIVTNLTVASSPQLVGPKLYTHLNNLIRFPIMETAGMMSPAVMKDLIAGQGPALNCHLKALKEPMAAVNLSRSLMDHSVDDVLVTDDLFDQTIRQLIKNFRTNGLENRSL